MEYLSTRDFLASEGVLQRHPALREALHAPETRAALLEWLRTDDAWSGTRDVELAAAIEHLHQNQRPNDVPTVQPFLLHGDPTVRLRAYEFLLSFYFPDHNREAVFQLLSRMLSDESESIRSAGAAYAARTGESGELQEFLIRWLAQASARGWAGTEAYDLVTRAVEKSGRRPGADEITE